MDAPFGKGVFFLIPSPARSAPLGIGAAPPSRAWLPLEVPYAYPLGNDVRGGGRNRDGPCADADGRTVREHSLPSWRYERRRERPRLPRPRGGRARLVCGGRFGRPAAGVGRRFPAPRHGSGAAAARTILLRAARGIEFLRRRYAVHRRSVPPRGPAGDDRRRGRRERQARARWLHRWSDPLEVELVLPVRLPGPGGGQRLESLRRAENRLRRLRIEVSAPTCP